MNTEDLRKLVTREMPFGKYEGRLIADLPANYLHWFAREGFPPGEIGRLLALMREIDHNGLTPLLTPLRQQAQAGMASTTGLNRLLETHRTPPAAPEVKRTMPSTAGTSKARHVPRMRNTMQPEPTLPADLYSPETLAPEAVQALSEPTVLEFGANCCGICQGAQPLIANAITSDGYGIRHIKIEDGAGRPLGRFFKVKLWPTLIVLKNGQEVGRIVRPTDSDSIARVLAALR